jgi:hypothetical protein
LEDTLNAKRRDAPILLVSHRTYDDRVSLAGPERELEPARGRHMNTAALPVTAASHLRKWPAEADRPIRIRSLSEASDNGRKAFRAMADWITIYLFALVEGGRLPQDGVFEYVIPQIPWVYVAPNIPFM